LSIPRRIEERKMINEKNDTHLSFVEGQWMKRALGT
jgi:hypothetical protein